MNHRKDKALDELARLGNVAQFVSFAPSANGLQQTYSRVQGHEPNHRFSDVSEAAAALLECASDRTLNVRSYAPDSPRSHEFLYALGSVAEIVSAANRLTVAGLHIILNETIDIADGGVSGVAQGDIIEFAPDDTPRCVEKPGVASLPLAWGLELLRTVYGFTPELPTQGRTEFSIHPRPRGWRGTHTLLWEWEEQEVDHEPASVVWPNRFSRHIGDKAFGLIIADIAGLLVPHTRVIARRVAPFDFGTPTGSDMGWTRTSPREQEPGLFTTVKGWTDPFALLQAEDPRGDRIASILYQDAVPATHSGAAILDAHGDLVVEGTAGDGDRLMLGARLPERLPGHVGAAVRTLHSDAQVKFGPVRLEWVFDGTRAWIVQLHVGATNSTAATLVPGDRAHWIRFDVGEGLEALRALLASFGADDGLELAGEVGLTSHVADLVRRAQVPTRIVPALA